MIISAVIVHSNRLDSISFCKEDTVLYEVTPSTFFIYSQLFWLVAVKGRQRFLLKAVVLPYRYSNEVSHTACTFRVACYKPICMQILSTFKYLLASGKNSAFLAFYCVIAIY